MKCPHCHYHIDDRFDDCIEAEPDYGPIVIGYKFCDNCNTIITYKHVYKRKDGSDYLENTIIIDDIQEEGVAHDNVPDEYSNDFNEAFKVLPHSPKASAALSRRCLQAVFQGHFKTKANNLADQIDEVSLSQHIPGYILDRLKNVRIIGNFSAHPLKNTSTGEVIDVEPHEAEWLIDTLESLFDFCFVQPKLLEVQKKEIDAKLKKAGKQPIWDKSDTKK
ncbi:MAG: DUF4145 domain-containing protein [Deltaproteobacteria bacterium]|nr:DUF4145 domain-containing protein [Deltaproteobacteria bacterium]